MMNMHYDWLLCSKSPVYLSIVAWVFSATSLSAQSNLSAIEKSGYDIEIRFYTHSSLLNLKNVKVLYYHTATWHATEYDEFNYKRELTVYALMPVKSIESVYSSLLEHKLTSSPDQADLLRHLDTTSSLKPEIVDKLLPTDGDWYTIEYKIGQDIRRYAFWLPEEYAYFYKKVQEFQDYLAIKRIFEEELKRRDF